MEKDLISIIIPVYNVEKYLDKCVKSILQQTYINLEVILVDDGSTDNSGVLCDSLAKDDNRIRVLHKSNGGLSDARNAGMRISSGRYVAFIDSDDYVDTHYIEILYKNAVETDSDISISNYEKFYEGETPENIDDNKNNHRIVMDRNQSLEALFEDEYKYQFTMAWGKIFAAKVLEGFEFPVGRNYEDSATAHVLISKARSVVYTNRKQYFYLTRKTSITKSDKFLKDDVIVAMRDRVEWFANNGYLELEKKAKVQYVLTMMGVYARLTNSIEAKKMKKSLYKEVRKTVSCDRDMSYSSKKTFFQIKLFLLLPSLYSAIIRRK